MIAGKRLFLLEPALVWGLQAGLNPQFRREVAFPVWRHPEAALQLPYLQSMCSCCRE
jgi:hypothetical protein